MRILLRTIAFTAVAAATSQLLFAQGSGNSQQVWDRLGPESGDVISLSTGPEASIYLGTADGHVFVSEDSGAHWELRGRAGTRFDAVVQKLLPDVQNPPRLFAAVWFQDPAAGGGVFRSEDAGRTWERISPAGDAELRNIDSLAVDPRDARVIYAGTYHLPWKTLDGGKTWRPVAAGMIDDSDIMSMRLDSTNPARLFASACSGIYRSESAGAQWIKLQGIPYAARRTQTIFQDPRDAKTLYAGTTAGLWVTHDAGETWARVTSPDWVVNAVAITALPRGSGARLLIGTEEQGVLSSVDGGLTFTPSNAGFSHRVIADLAANPRDPQHLLARLAQQLLETRNAGKTWQPFPSGPPRGGAKKFYGAEDGWWAALANGGLARYDDASQKWQKIAFAPTPNAPARARRKLAAKQRSATTTEPDPEVADLFFDGPRVYAATSQGVWSGEWRAHLLQRFAQTIFPGSVLGIVASRSGEQLVAVTPTKLIRTEDAGKSWHELAPPTDAGELLWLATPPRSQRPAVAAEFAQYWMVGATNGVYLVPTDSQDSWQLLQSGLPAGHSSPPAISAESMALTMITGGFYLTRDRASTWERLDTGHEAGIFTRLLGDGRGGYFAASRSEGILHLTRPPAKD